MTSIYLGGNSAYDEWCEANGYNGEDQHDYEEEVYKRGSHQTFYIKKNDEDTYALVTCSADYDWGRDDIEIQKEGLKRTEKQITTTTVVYE